MTLDVITSAHLAPFAHGFFGRAGGASSGIFAGLNCGGGSSDQAEAVRINRARVAAHLDLPPEALVGVHQVHGDHVVTVEGPPEPGRPRARADALVTAEPGLGLSILTADCQPVLFADPVARVVGAAHGGWRGTVAGVLEATVAAMERLGARAGDVRAVIGPTISQRAYEVGPEFRDAVLLADPGAARHFAGGEGDRLHFDLPGYGMARLTAAGLAEVAWTRHCTYSDAGRFFSYRRSVHAREADYGRLIAAIRL